MYLNCAYLQQKLKDLKVYCQNMACGVLELCLIATKIEGFKSVLPKYGMLCTRIVLNCNKNLRI
jgi:hypothetical protein